METKEVDRIGRMLVMALAAGTQVIIGAEVWQRETEEGLLEACKAVGEVEVVLSSRKRSASFSLFCSRRPPLSFHHLGSSVRL